MDKELSTLYIRDEIGKCEDVEELKNRIFPMLKEFRQLWEVKINEIISQSGYNKTEFAKLCDVSRMSVNKWCNGAMPRNRETFLKIGMAAGYNREQVDQLLQRYGRYPALYPKSLEDCICIYVLENEKKEERIEKYNYILEKIKSKIINSDNKDVDVPTKFFDEKLSDVEDESGLEKFIEENSAAFSTAYNRLYSYIKMELSNNYGVDADNIYKMADMQNWSSSLTHCVYAINQKKWYPTRNKIISLGLHLSMDMEQIDDMLDKAHMEPLCAKNIFESIIMYILEDASINNMLDVKKDNFDPDELCRQAKEVLSDFDIPEVEVFINEVLKIDGEDE